jgi:hypothetical protein
LPSSFPCSLLPGPGPTPLTAGRNELRTFLPLLENPRGSCKIIQENDFLKQLSFMGKPACAKVVLARKTRA